VDITGGYHILPVDITGRISQVDITGRISQVDHRWISQVISQVGFHRWISQVDITGIHSLSCAVAAMHTIPGTMQHPTMHGNDILPYLRYPVCIHVISYHMIPYHMI